MQKKCFPVAGIFFLLLFIISFRITAQDSEDWYYGKTITTIEFDGLNTVKERDVQGIKSSFEGKKFTEELFNDLIERIYAMDLFEDVTPTVKHAKNDPEKIDLIITVKEHPVIKEIDFSGNRKIRNGELRDTITIKQNDVYVKSNVLVEERKIRDLYLQKGFMDIHVTSKTQETKDGIVVTFVIDEGNSTSIATIKFKGNKTFSDKTLKKKMELQEKTLFHKGAFQEATLEKDKQSIISFYNSEGYIDAQIIDVVKESSVDKKENSNKLTLTFVIQEGSQYTWNGIVITGNNIFSTDKLQGLIKLTKGDIFNQSLFQEGMQAIQTLYVDNGYTSNAYSPKENKNPDTKTISYVLNIVENARSHIEKIIIKGNTRTREDIIRRELPIESGDVFSRAKITTGLRNLYNLQYFSAIVPDIVRGSEENLVDLVISVEEQNTTTLEFGMTFSGVSDPDDWPIALYVKLSDSNFKGTGQSVSLNTSVSKTEQSVSVGYSKNWLFGHPISFSESLTFTHANEYALRNKWLTSGAIDDDSYYLEYEHWKFSLNTSLGRRWTPDFAILSVSGGITNSLLNNIYDEDLYNPLDYSVSDYANNWGLQNSLWTAFSIDDRDINYDPSKGWFSSETLSWYGLTPWETEFFLKSSTRAEFYKTLINIPVTDSWSFKTVFAASTYLSMQFPVPNTSIGDSDKLYIDGMFNGRGWTDIYDTVKGEALWSTNLELRIPLVKSIIALDGFFDAAALKDTPTEMFTDLTVQDFYFSTGPGLRFTIPQFPIRFLLANTFRATDSGSIKWYDKWNFVLSFNIVNK